MSKKDLGVSIIICCYNSAARLPETIKYISEQKVSANINWEVVIINNASKDNTREIAARLCEKTFKNIQYKIIDENEPGLSNARKRGIDDARYEFLLFCDDDNWLLPDYVQRSFDTMVRKPTIGALGSQSVGEYESTPPSWFLQNLNAFAIGKQSTMSEDISFKKGSVWGAGIVVRKSNYELLKKCGFEFILTGRTGSKVTTGEDRELCYAIKKIGFTIFYDQNLILRHYMTAARFDYKKFLNLTFQNGRCSVVNDAYNGHTKNYVLYFIANCLLTVLKLLFASVLFFVTKLFSSSSALRYKSERRVYYFTGRLKVLFQFSYCKEVMRKIYRFENAVLKIM